MTYAGVMTFDQTCALVVMIASIAGLVWGKLRSDVVALTSAAILLGLGVVRPAEAQGAFASPALIALASLFVIAYALELSGLLAAVIRLAIRLCRRWGPAGLWVVIGMCGVVGGFLNNTPIVVLAAPVVRDVARSLGMSPQRFLIPVSYVTVLGGCCTLIGTSTNLLVNDMARNAGQPAFSIFEITPVGVSIALAGGLYLVLFAGRLLPGRELAVETPVAQAVEDSQEADGGLADPTVFHQDRPLDLKRGLMALGVFVAVVLVSSLGYAPIASAAFTGAVVLILTRVISADDAYRGIRPEILLLIAGMVVIGMSLELSGLAGRATNALTGAVGDLPPLVALAVLYGITLVLTEALSNAAVAVLLTPVAVALGQTLGVSPRPFMVAVMMAASAAFATPFGYQTNVLVFEMGGYRYVDFLKIGLPLNLITWAVAVVAIPIWFPF